MQRKRASIGTGRALSFTWRPGTRLPSTRDRRPPGRFPDRIPLPLEQLQPGDEPGQVRPEREAGESRAGTASAAPPASASPSRRAPRRPQRRRAGAPQPRCEPPTRAGHRPTTANGMRQLEQPPAELVADQRRAKTSRIRKRVQQAPLEEEGVESTRHGADLPAVLGPRATRPAEPGSALRPPTRRGSRVPAR